MRRMMTGTATATTIVVVLSSSLPLDDVVDEVAESADVGACEAVAAREGETELGVDEAWVEVGVEVPLVADCAGVASGVVDVSEVGLTSIIWVLSAVPAAESLVSAERARPSHGM